MSPAQAFDLIFDGRYPWPNYQSVQEPELLPQAEAVNRLQAAVDDWLWSYPEPFAWDEAREQELYRVLAEGFPWLRPDMADRIFAYASWYGRREGMLT